MNIKRLTEYYKIIWLQVQSMWFASSTRCIQNIKNSDDSTQRIRLQGHFQSRKEVKDLLPFGLLTSYFVW